MQGQGASQLWPRDPAAQPLEPQDPQPAPQGLAPSSRKPPLLPGLSGSELSLSRLPPCLSQVSSPRREATLRTAGEQH